MCSGIVCGMLFPRAVPQQASLQKNGEKEYQVPCLEKAVQDVEGGFLTAIRIDGRQQRPLRLFSLLQRFRRSLVILRRPQGGLCAARYVTLIVGL